MTAQTNSRKFPGGPPAGFSASRLCNLILAAILSTGVPVGWHGASLKHAF